MDSDNEKQPNCYDQSGFQGIILQIQMKAGRILMDIKANKTPPWVEQEPTEWVMLLMDILKHISRNLLNYREVRKGFIEIAACCLLIINYADQVFDEHKQGKN